MDQKILERAVEAAAKAMCADEVASAYSSAEWDDPDCDRGWYLRNARAAVAAALAEVEATIKAERDELAARVARVEAERDRLKRGGHTLGKIMDRWGEAIIAATGSESLVDEDRDGDWQVIEERLAGLRPELVDLRSRVARVEALHRDGLGDCRECEECGTYWPCPTIEALRGES